MYGTLNKAKGHITSRGYSYLLSAILIWYGRQLVKFPEILQNYKVYERIRVIFVSEDIGYVFMALGIAFLVATLFDLARFKKWLLPCISFLWVMFGLSFLVTEPPSTIGGFCIAFGVLTFLISTRGDFRGR